MSEKEAKTVPSKKVNIVRGFKKGKGGMTANVVGQKQLYDYASGPQTGKDTEDYGPDAAEVNLKKSQKKAKSNTESILFIKPKVEELRKEKTPDV